MYKKHYGIILTVLLIPSRSTSNNIELQKKSSETAYDFVVECYITTGAKSFSHSRKNHERKIYVFNSGDRGWCGEGNLREHSSINILHPTYRLPVKHRSEPGQDHPNDIGKKITRMLHWRDYNKQARQLFKSGYWDQDPDPVTYYLDSIHDCKITEEYLSLYNKASRPDFDTLKQRYYNDIQECKRQKAELYHKHGIYVNEYYYYKKDGEYHNCELFTKCSGKEYLPELTIKSQMEYMWNEKRWSSYQKDAEEKKNRQAGRKQTYLVGYDHPEGGGVWFLMDAYSKNQITNKYPEFKPFDDRPKWMSRLQKESFVKDCNDKVLHWDLEKPATGWLLEYKQGKKTRPCEKVKYIHINQGVIR